MQQRASQLESGALIGGYRIDELISRGGMGMVYLATNVALNRPYALKVLAPELAEDEHYRQRFRREIRLAASLHHPNVVAVHYAGEHEGSLFVVMDYIDGSDLRELLVKNGALEPHHAVNLLIQVCAALDAAHEKGLVHRDVKPANVLISSEHGDEHAYLTDFGLAKRSDVMTALTATGLIAGTIDYMAPEQIRGLETDARTDIYALGCVFFQMLTGTVPYTRDNSMAVLFAHVHDDPPPLTGSLADLYPAFGRVIETAMAKEPKERYPSAGRHQRRATGRYGQAAAGAKRAHRPRITGVDLHRRGRRARFSAGRGPPAGRRQANENQRAGLGAAAGPTTRTTSLATARAARRLSATAAPVPVSSTCLPGRRRGDRRRDRLDFGLFVRTGILLGGGGTGAGQPRDGKRKRHDRTPG